MNNLLAYIPAFPLLGFLVLSIAGRKLSKNMIALTGAGTVCISAIISLVIAAGFISSPPAEGFITTSIESDPY